MLNLRDHYVYIYLDPRKKGPFRYGEKVFDYEPFYVGMGKGYRYKGHLKQSARKLQGKPTYINKHKIRKINKILSQGLFPIILKYKENLTTEEALQEEMQVIRVIGRVNLKTGPLTNQTDGGDGCRNQSPESRYAYGQKMQEKYRKGELIPWNKGKKNFLSEETTKNISKTLKIYYETHTTWNKDCVGKQTAWNKNLTKEDPRVNKYALARKRGHKYKEYKFIKNGELVIIQNMVKFCNENNLNRRDMSALHNKGFREVKWMGNNGIVHKYKYLTHRGYSKYIEEA